MCAGTNEYARRWSDHAGDDPALDDHYLFDDELDDLEDDFDADDDDDAWEPYDSVSQVAPVSPVSPDVGQPQASATDMPVPEGTQRESNPAFRTGADEQMSRLSAGEWGYADEYPSAQTDAVHAFVPGVVASGDVQVDQQAALDSAGSAPLTADEHAELLRLRAEQVEWERRELEYLRQERDAARERARQRLVMEAERAALHAEADVYDASGTDYSAAKDAAGDTSSVAPAQAQDSAPTEAAMSVSDAGQADVSRRHESSPSDDDRRIAEARERGRKLMQPDEDDLAMPRGQKIVLVVIVVLVIVSLLIMLLPMI